MWKTALLTLLIFGLGSLAGGLVTSRVIHSRIQKEGLAAVKPDRTPPPGMEAEWNAAQIEVMQRQVGLTAEQRGKAEVILSTAQQDVQKMREEWKTRVRELLQGADRSVAGMLTPEQRARFDEFLRKRRQFWQRRPQQGQPFRDRIQQFRENMNGQRPLPAP